MHAAVVTALGHAPVWQEFEEPVPADGEVVVEVVAAGLHPRVRAQADGSHYTSEGALPLIPGVDGVGRFPDGTLRYFAVTSDTRGTMAERVAADPRASVVLPEDADPVAVAAGANPVMSSWVALRRRIAFEPGSRVLVLGATGASGRAAVQVAKHLGAAHVVASGRDAVRLAALPDLGADQVVSLDDVEAVGTAAADVDVVIDYVWGEPAADVMRALVTARSDRGRRLDWIAIGSTAGQEARIPSAALRASGLTIVGSGQGSVGRAAFVAELPGIVDAIADGSIRVDATGVRMAAVDAAWAGQVGTPAGRVVLEV
ncbi:zinc-binding alcohol dehydrogenase family protein [Curtobacterium pusillum]|uniref:NADPH:quinone reductase-like Zn-dependent oxidoreductase n=1 Tax=Curtobacterium pusillum TaxID=69373 RepID=A0AAW3T393_9MICO|nr:zinc-binding alcohol dehydrogenase family protein [Curtobacterium pusillum]MBA8989514.1 NADPH:quinone reductase-like Zn-dependent oxidoreductase [Curtobacterium pusillum]NUU14987.1 zinc-binding alcohol dehydrogenase family protein [Curtobacterium pusillum]GLK32549.1 NADPH:quinone reductase [Curtobacterium pusillum]